MVDRVSSSFPKDGNSARNDINEHKVKRHRNSDTKTRQQRTTTERSVMNYSF